MKKIAIVNGPNLNLLGKREPEIYGSQTFEEYLEIIRDKFKAEADLSYFQSNHEGAIIDYLHQIGFSYDGIVLNAGALTHTSIAISDSIAAIESPVMEVHISDIHQREEYRRHSYMTEKCLGFIGGLGLKGYALAIECLLEESGR